MATHLELGDVLDGLNAMKARGLDLRPVWRSVRKLLYADVKEHFASQESPGGRWPPRAQTTEDKRRRRRRRNLTQALGKRKRRRIPPRQVLGRLRTAWAFEVTPRALTMSSKAPWAGVHQQGGIAGHGAHIPQREFAWVSEQFVGTVLTPALVEHVRSAW